MMAKSNHDPASGGLKDSPVSLPIRSAHPPDVRFVVQISCTGSDAIAGAFGVTEIASSSPRRSACACDDGHDILKCCRRNVKVPQSGQIAGRNIVAPHQRDLVARERGAGRELGQKSHGLPQDER